VGLSLYVPLVVSVLLAVTAPRAGRRLPPRTAAWTLVSVAVVAAGAWTTVLAMIGFTLVAQIPDVAREGRWSPHLLAADTPVEWPVAAASVLVVIVCATTLTVASWRRVKEITDAWRQCRDLPTAGGLAVLDDPVPAAFALPGAPGRIVVSSGMLRALSADERRALLAHERAHLKRRHHLFLLVLQLSASVHPLLRPVARTGGFALERWADEEAVEAVHDRSLVARAIARAALVTKGASAPRLAATSGPVPERVSALLSPPARARRDLVAGFASLMLLCCASLGLAAHRVDQLFDSAAPPARPTASTPRSGLAEPLPRTADRHRNPAPAPTRGRTGTPRRP
jgi:Zn-dependent protease with chaperone function